MAKIKNKIICLALKILPGNFELSKLENMAINLTVQNLNTLVENKFAFADIIFPIIEMKLSSNDSFGISRTYMDENPYSSIFEDNKLAGKMSKIEIYSLNRFKLMKLFDLKLPIQIKFNVTKEVDEYYCMYYNETDKEFSDYNIKTINTENDGVICETTHLSLFGVATEPLRTIGRKNNAKMLYKFNALKKYEFWKSSSN